MKDGVVHFLDHDFETLIPTFDVSFYKHDFGFWVSVDEFFGEADGW